MIEVVVPESPAVPEDEQRAFYLVVRSALLMMVKAIERRYRLPAAGARCPQCSARLRSHR